MKLGYSVFPLLMAGIAMFVGANNGILTNGSFETGDLTGWNTTVGGTDSAAIGVPANVAPQSGSFAALLTLGSGVSELRQSFPAAPGDEFYFSGHMLTESALPDGPSFGLFKIVFQDIDGNDLAPASISLGQPNADFPGVESLPFLQFMDPIDTWLFSEAEGVAPAGTVQVVFLALNVDFGGDVNPIWFDNLEAYNTNDNVNLLTNPDFETGDFTGWLEPPMNVTFGAPTGGAQDGTVAAQLAQEAATTEINQRMPAAPGDEFNLSGYMLTEAALPVGPSFGVLKIVFKDASGADLAPASVSEGTENIDFPGIDSDPLLNSDSTPDTWTFSQAQGVAPAGTVEVVFLVLNVDFAGGENPIWFDNIVACEINDIITVVPTSVTTTAGTFSSGDEVSLAGSDNSDYQVRRSGGDVQSRTQFEVKGVSSIANPTSFEFTLEGSTFARQNVVQRIEFFDYDANAWEIIGSQNAARSPSPDSVMTVAGTGDLSRFVEDGTGCIEARVRYRSDNPRQNFTSNTDQTIWTIE